MKLGIMLLAGVLISATAIADIGIRPPRKGPVDTTIGTNPPARGKPGRPGIGRFEQKQRAQRVVEKAAKVSGLNSVMKEDQPNDLKNLKAILVKGMLQDADAYEIVEEIANLDLPSDPQERQEEQFNAQMTLTLLAGQYGYQEQDN